MRKTTSSSILLPLLSLSSPLLVSAQASSCAASYTPFSTYCCSGTLLSSHTGSTSGTAIISPGSPSSASGTLVTLPTNTLPAPTITGSIASGSLATTGLSTLPVSLPGPHPTSVQVTNPNTAISNGVTYTSFNPLPSSDIVPLPGSQRHSVSGEGVPPREGSAISPTGSGVGMGSMSGSVLGPGVTCFGAVSTVVGPGVTSATGVTSFGSSGAGGASGSASAGSGGASGSASTAAAAPVKTGLAMEVLGAVVGVLGVGML